MHSALNPFKITVVKDLSVIADVILDYKTLTKESLAFWPITERRRIDLKKGETRNDLDNIEIVANHAATRDILLAMPAKGARASKMNI
jgi:hypothetical protein